MPPEYHAFYPMAAPVIGSPTPAQQSDDCVPVRDLPYIRSLAPAKFQDDYCVPAKFLPFYKPGSSSEQAIPDGGQQPSGGDQGGEAAMYPMVSSPQVKSMFLWCNICIHENIYIKILCYCYFLSNFFLFPFFLRTY